MTRFYKVALTKITLGSAIEYRAPALQGDIVIKVFDSTSGGDCELIVAEADDDQHQANSAVDGVEVISEADAMKLASKYQPARTFTRLDPSKMTEEKQRVPAFDLHAILRDRV